MLGTFLTHHGDEGLGYVFVGLGHVTATKELRRRYRTGLYAIRSFQQIVIYLLGDDRVLSVIQNT